MKNLTYVLAFLALGCFAVSGCDNAAKKGDQETSAKKDGHDHDHEGHDHDDDHEGHDHGDMGALGKHGGHMYKFAPAEMKLEWVHSKNNKNDFYLIGDDGDDKPMKVDAFTVTSDVGETETFDIEPVNADDAGATAKYSLSSPELARAMTFGVTVKVKVGEKEYSCKIAAHEPHTH